MLCYFCFPTCPVDTCSSLSIRVRCLVAESRHIPANLSLSFHAARLSSGSSICCCRHIIMPPCCLTQTFPGWYFTSFSCRKFLWLGRSFMCCCLLIPIWLPEVQRQTQSKSTNGEWRVNLYTSSCKTSSFGPMFLRFYALTGLFFLLDTLA